jgi:hypothetical protein
VLQLPELGHVALPEALHERLKPWAERPAEFRSGQPRLYAVLGLPISDFWTCEATKSNKYGEHLVGLRKAHGGQYLPGRLGIVEYHACKGAEG